MSNPTRKHIILSSLFVTNIYVHITLADIYTEPKDANNLQHTTMN